MLTSMGATPRLRWDVEMTTDKTTALATQSQATVLGTEDKAGAAQPSVRIKWLKRLAGLLAAIVLVALAYYLRDLAEPLKKFGYPGLFLISLLGNATIFIPAPAYVSVMAAATILNPLLIGIVAGLGAALGELTAYLAGTSGRGVIVNQDAYRRFEPIIQRYDVMAIALLAAIPNPLFDVAGILCGMLHIPAWQFVLAAWVGKSIRFSLLAIGVSSSLPLLNQLF